MFTPDDFQFIVDNMNRAANSVASLIQAHESAQDEIEVLIQERDNALLRIEELEHELSKREMAEAGS